MFQQHLHLAHRVDGEIVHAVVDTAAELHEVQHFFIHAGNLRVNLLRHGLISVMEGNVDPGVGQHCPVALRHRQPVNIDAHIIEELADLQPVARLADRHHFMECGLNLKAVAHIVRCKTAGHVVLFQNQDILDAPGLQLEACGHTRQRSADDDHLIMVLIKTHRLFLISFLYIVQAPASKCGSFRFSCRLIRRISPRARGSIQPSRPYRRRT